MNPAIRLWKARLAAHLKLIARYTVYAGQSGFFLFVFAAFIATSYLYGKSLAHIPQTFPFAVALTFWMLPFLAVSPVRTLLRQADLVFLLPMEAQMGAYFRRSILYSFVTQAVVTIFAVSASMPLYRHDAGISHEPYIAMLGCAMLAKLANLVGAWMESCFVRRRNRALFRALRWIADALIAYALFRYGVAAACAALLAGIVLLGLFARFARTLSVNWLILHRKEQRHNSTLLHFFNGFVDVAQLPTRVKARPVLAKLATFVPFRQANSFIYLYALTLLRTELFGIMARLTAIALVLLLLLDSSASFACVYALFVILTNVQLHTLGRFHRYSVWPALYPLPAALRPLSAARVAFAAQLAIVVLLALPMLRPTVFAAWLPLMPLLGAALAYATFRRHSREPERNHSLVK
ncbi:MAG: transporter permease [Paenibacillus sp.]|jgi:ABC-2 type transport system permease protein|nr:transporter permease [Paenibacillus sp.]